MAMGTAKIGFKSGESKVNTPIKEASEKNKSKQTKIKKEGKKNG